MITASSYKENKDYYQIRTQDLSEKGKSRIIEYNQGLLRKKALKKTIKEVIILGSATLITNLALAIIFSIIITPFMPFSIPFIITATSLPVLNFAVLYKAGFHKKKVVKNIKNFINTSTTLSISVLNPSWIKTERNNYIVRIPNEPQPINLFKISIEEENQILLKKLSKIPSTIF